MAVHLSILFMISGFTGIRGIYTVSRVSVKAGDSVSIPCFYGPGYKNHVKYLCKGFSWRDCTYEIKTNQPYSTKYSISDDKNQGVFTVTIKDLTDEDTYFWCIVEINNGTDDGVRFLLQVTKNIPSLSVNNQEIRGFYGEMTTINCSYKNGGESRWCRISGNCVTESWRPSAGSRITINSSVPNVFIVTMSELTMEDSGWYWCERGDLQMPVHLTVTERNTTTNTSGSGNFNESNPGQENQSRSPVDLLSLIVPLIWLLIVILVAVLIWFVLRRRRKSKEPSSDVSAICTRSNVYVTYSDVLPMRRTNKPRVKTNDENTYSTVTYRPLS